MFRATQYTTAGFVSLVSLNLIQTTTHRFAFTLYEIIHRAKSVRSRLESSRKFYEAIHIQNLVRDGTRPFPEDSAQVQSGIELEFRYAPVFNRSW